MAKDDDHAELLELKKWVAKKQVEDGVNYKIRVICISTTATFLSVCGWMGKLIYENSKAVEAGIRAFWEATKGNH